MDQLAGSTSFGHVDHAQGVGMNRHSLGISLHPAATNEEAVAMNTGMISSEPSPTSAYLQLQPHERGEETGIRSGALPDASTSMQPACKGAAGAQVHRPSQQPRSSTHTAEQAPAPQSQQQYPNTAARSEQEAGVVAGANKCVFMLPVPKPNPPQQGHPVDFSHYSAQQQHPQQDPCSGLTPTTSSLSHSHKDADGSGKEDHAGSNSIGHSLGHRHIKRENIKAAIYASCGHDKDTGGVGEGECAAEGQEAESPVDTSTPLPHLPNLSLPLPLPVLALPGGWASQTSALNPTSIHALSAPSWLQPGRVHAVVGHMEGGGVPSPATMLASMPPTGLMVSMTPASMDAHLGDSMVAGPASHPMPREGPLHALSSVAAVPPLHPLSHQQHSQDVHTDSSPQQQHHHHHYQSQQVQLQQDMQRAHGSSRQPVQDPADAHQHSQAQAQLSLCRLTETVHHLSHLHQQVQSHQLPPSQLSQPSQHPHQQQQQPPPHSQNEADYPEGYVVVGVPIAEFMAAQAQAAATVWAWWWQMCVGGLPGGWRHGAAGVGVIPQVEPGAALSPFMWPTPLMAPSPMHTHQPAQQQAPTGAPAHPPPPQQQLATAVEATGHEVQVASGSEVIGGGCQGVQQQQQQPHIMQHAGAAMMGLGEATRFPAPALPAETTPAASMSVQECAQSAGGGNVTEDTPSPCTAQRLSAGTAGMGEHHADVDGCGWCHVPDTNDAVGTTNGADADRGVRVVEMEGGGGNYGQDVCMGEPEVQMSGGALTREGVGSGAGGDAGGEDDSCDRDPSQADALQGIQGLLALAETASAEQGAACVPATMAASGHCFHRPASSTTPTPTPLTHPPTTPSCLALPVATEPTQQPIPLPQHPSQPQLPSLQPLPRPQSSLLPAQSHSPPPQLLASMSLPPTLNRLPPLSQEPHVPSHTLSHPLPQPSLPQPQPLCQPPQPQPHPHPHPLPQHPQHPSQHSHQGAKREHSAISAQPHTDNKAWGGGSGWGHEAKRRVPAPHPHFAGDNKGGDNKVCSNCGTRATPFWRKHRCDGRPLCNACGLYAAKNEAPRPRALWREGEGADCGEGGGPEAKMPTHQGAGRALRSLESVLGALGALQRGGASSARSPSALAAAVAAMVAAAAKTGACSMVAGVAGAAGGGDSRVDAVTKSGTGTCQPSLPPTLATWLAAAAAVKAQGATAAGAGGTAAAATSSATGATQKQAAAGATNLPPALMHTLLAAAAATAAGGAVRRRSEGVAYISPASSVPTKVASAGSAAPPLSHPSPLAPALAACRSTFRAAGPTLVDGVAVVGLVGTEAGMGVGVASGEPAEQGCAPPLLLPPPLPLDLSMKELAPELQQEGRPLL